MTFSETLKTLSDSQLRKLERALTLIANGKRDVEPDQMLASLAPPLTAEAQHLVDARAYEICIERPNVPFDQAIAQAIQDYRSGRLNKPKPKRRHRPRQATKRPNGSPTYPAPAKTNPCPLQGRAEASATPTPAPNNVIPLHPRAFVGTHAFGVGVKWIGGETSFPGDYGNSK